jgi:DNA anti-recombination protein RmuC
MEIVFPVSMLALGLTIGAVSLWFITRTKLKYEFERGRAHGETERAVLQTRLEEERKAHQEKLTLLNNAEGKLADAFKALSADALRSNNQSISPGKILRRFSKQRKAISNDAKTRLAI